MTTSCQTEYLNIFYEENTFSLSQQMPRIIAARLHTNNTHPWLRAYTGREVSDEWIYWIDGKGMARGWVVWAIMRLVLLRQEGSHPLRARLSLFLENRFFFLLFKARREGCFTTIVCCLQSMWRLTTRSSWSMEAFLRGWYPFRKPGVCLCYALYAATIGLMFVSTTV